MTLGPGFTMGTEETPLEVRAIYVDADGDSGEDIVVMGSGTIYTKKSGFYLKRDGTGLLKLEFTKGSIVAEGDSEGVGIYLRHKGEAGEEAKGIHISSGTDIDLSAHTDNVKRGIHATTTGADPTAVIPIEIRGTGGTIDVSDPPGSSVGGIAVRAEQFAKGDIAVTVEKAAMLGTKDAVAGDAGIEAWLRPRSEGDIVITHRGGIHAATGIVADNETASSEKGDITITTEAGSTITTNEQGISTSVDEAASTGDITITHNGEIDADGTGISVTNKGKGDVTVTTGKDSKVTGGDEADLGQTRSRRRVQAERYDDGVGRRVLRRGRRREQGPRRHAGPEREFLNAEPKAAGGGDVPALKGRQGEPRGDADRHTENPGGIENVRFSGTRKEKGHGRTDTRRAAVRCDAGRLKSRGRPWNSETHNRGEPAASLSGSCRGRCRRCP